MKNISLLIIGLFILGLSAMAQNIGRVYKNHLKPDFEKAYELYVKILEDNNSDAAAHFGLAILYADEDFARKDYFLAWQHALDAEKNFSKISGDDLEEMEEFLTEIEGRRSSHPVKKKFEKQVEIIEYKLIKYVREEKDMVLINTFIDQFPDSKYYENVIHIRNYLEYAKVRRKNTIEGYRQFMKEFPGAAQVPLALEALHELAFQDANSKRSIEALNRFMKEYPDADHYLQALQLRNELAFKKAKTTGNLVAIENFIRDYPDAIQVPAAKKIQMKLLYEKAKKINTLEAYEEFIAKYPEGDFFFDVFNLKANSLGKKYQQRNTFSGMPVVYTKAFDNDGRDDKPAGIHVDGGGDILLFGNSYFNDTVGYSPWLIKLNNHGDVIWDKSLDIKKNVIVTTVVVNNNGEILAGGTAENLMDTLPAYPWIGFFSPNGKMFWDKELKIANVTDLSFDNGGNILLAGNTVDSMGISHYYMAKYKNTSKRLWERDYSSSGILSSIDNLDNNVLVGGNQWIFMTDSDGYLKWESLLNSQDSITCIATVAEQGQLFVGCSRGNMDIVIKQFTAEGSVLGENIFDAGNVEIPRKLRVKGKDIMIGGTSGSSAYFIQTNALGQITGEYMIGGAGAMKVVDMQKDIDGKTLLLISGNLNNDHDYILVKL